MKTEKSRLLQVIQVTLYLAKFFVFQLIREFLKSGSETILK
jgi:hypothetical protein